MLSFSVDFYSSWQALGEWGSPTQPLCLALSAFLQLLTEPAEHSLETCVWPSGNCASARSFCEKSFLLLTTLVLDAVSSRTWHSVWKQFLLYKWLHFLPTQSPSPYQQSPPLFPTIVLEPGCICSALDVLICSLRVVLPSPSWSCIIYH